MNSSIRPIFLFLVFLLLSSKGFAQCGAVTWLPIPQFFSTLGQPLAGGQFFSYAAGTTTPQATCTDSTGLVQNADPLTLDSTGKPASGIWITSQGYKFIVKDAFGNIQFFVDNVVFGSATSSTAFSTLTASTNSHAGSFVASGNTWNFNAATFLIPLSAGCVPTASSSICYDSTNNVYSLGQNGSTIWMGTGTCASNKFVTALGTSAATPFTCTQPAFSNLSGSATTGQLPGSGVTTINGVACTIGSSCNAAEQTWTVSCGAGVTLCQSMNGLGILGATVLTNSHTLIRYTIQAIQSGTLSSCSPSPVISFRDETAASNLAQITVTNGTSFFDSGALSVGMTAGHKFSFNITTASASCTGPPFMWVYTAVYQ
jgi:hypothetical protein